MDSITNKSYKDYDYISRYATFPYYYNETDDKYVQGITGQLSDKSTFILHKVKPGETLDSIALDNYSNSTYFWVIADFNRIRDPFKKLVPGTTIKVPTIADIKFRGL